MDEVEDIPCRSVFSLIYELCECDCFINSNSNGMSIRDSNRKNSNLWKLAFDQLIFPKSKSGTGPTRVMGIFDILREPTLRNELRLESTEFLDLVNEAESLSDGCANLSSMFQFLLELRNVKDQEDKSPFQNQCYRSSFNVESNLTNEALNLFELFGKLSKIEGELTHLKTEWSPCFRNGQSDEIGINTQSSSVQPLHNCGPSVDSGFDVSLDDLLNPPPIFKRQPMLFGNDDLKIFNSFYLAHRSNEHNTISGQFSHCEETNLFCDTINALLGVSSLIFNLDKDELKFSLSDAFRETTSLSVLGQLDDFAVSATYYVRLKYLMEENSNKGKVYTAFQRGLRTYLNCYSEFIGNLDSADVQGLLQLLRITRSLREQLRFLAEVCLVDIENGFSCDYRSEMLPTGLDLLIYIQQVAEECISDDNSQLMLYFVRLCWFPLLFIARRWMFEGVSDDTSNEFFKLAQDSYLIPMETIDSLQDSILSSRSFTASAMFSARSLLCQDSCIQEIHSCGKLLNLLRMCGFDETTLVNMDASENLLNLDLLDCLDLKTSMALEYPSTESLTEPSSLSLRIDDDRSLKNVSLTKSAYSSPDRKSLHGQKSIETVKEPDEVDALYLIVDKSTGSQCVELKTRGRNIHGHASDSSIQKLLGWTEVPEQRTSQSKKYSKGGLFSSKFCIQSDLTDFTGCYGDLEGIADMRKKLTSAVDVSSEYHEMNKYFSLDVKLVPIAVTVGMTIGVPIHKQFKFINSVCLDFFMSVLKLEQHMELLVDVFLFKDSGFVSNLTYQLFEKIDLSPRPVDLLNPVTLNAILKQSVLASNHVNDLLSNHLSFAVTYTPKTFVLCDANMLDCLTMSYTVPPPLDLIVTESHMVKYGKIWNFMLSIKRAMWSLSTVYYSIKLAMKKFNVVFCGNQCIRIKAMWHSMTTLLNALEGYFVSEGLQKCYSYLKAELHSGKITSIEHLKAAHSRFINRVYNRCFLNTKADHFLKLIDGLLVYIHKFGLQLRKLPWQCDVVDGSRVLVHPNYETVVKIHEAFTKRSRIYYNVLKKVSVKRLHSHLDNIVTRLSFNSYFTTAA